jgi:hypothetical protein
MFMSIVIASFYNFLFRRLVPATWAFLKVRMFVTKSFPPLSIGVALLRVGSEPCPQVLGQEVTNSEKPRSGVANSR